MTASSEIVVRIAKDRRSATMTVPTGLSAEQLNVGILAQIAEDAGVEVGPATELRLQQLLERCADPHDGPVELVIAEVAEPVDGDDACIRWREGCDPEAVEAGVPAIRHDRAATGPAGDQVDHYRTVHFVQVEKGMEIATLRPATEGRDGRDVCGGTLPARAGRPLSHRIEDSVETRPDGTLVAAESGALLLGGGSLRITRLLEIAACVDFSTGNIDFDGSVNVREGVRDRFVVRATGDVAVEGLVESATLVVGGTLLLKRGMAARERGMISVEGDCRGGFFNSVRGRIRGDLEVRRELMDCHLMVGGDVRAEGAAIVGGVLAVTGALHVGTLGSDGGAPTRIVLEEVPFSGAKLARAERTIAALRARRDELRGTLDGLVEGGASSSVRGRERCAVVERELAEIDARLNAAEVLRRGACHAIRDGRRLDLVVGRDVHPRVHLHIRGRDFVFEDRVRGPLRIVRDSRDGLVVHRPGARPRPIGEVTHELGHAA